MTLGNRDLTSERIHLQHQLSSIEQISALRVVWIGGNGRFKVALSKIVAAEREGSAPRSRQCRRVMAIQFQAESVLGDRVLVVLGLEEKICDAYKVGRIVSQMGQVGVGRGP